MSKLQLFCAAIVGGLVAIMVFVAIFPRQTVQLAAGTTPQGGTYNNAFQASIAGIALATPGTNATSSSILNGSSNDRYLTSIKLGCEGIGTSKTAYTGAGLAALTVTMSTTSTAAPAAGGTTISSLTIGTSTPTFVQASSTSAVGTGSYLYVWPASSYLTFISNATNTATCTFGADYFNS